MRRRRQAAGGRRSWQPTLRIHDSREVTLDADTLALVQRLEGALSWELDVPIGVTQGDLDRRIGSVRAREASFGDLVGAAVRARMNAQVGLMNGGGARGNRLYPAGSTLTRRDIRSELPFGNTTMLVEIRGTILRVALENGFADLGRPCGRFLQVCGLVVTLEAAAPPGSRVVSLSVGGVPLDDGRRYTVAVNNFMLEGGNGYGMLADGRILVGATDGRLLANEVMAYLKAHSPLAPVSGGRILVR